MSSGTDHDLTNADDATAGQSGGHRDEYAASPRVVDSASLLEGRSQLAILHNEAVYFLRQTRFGKLILTK